jgi:hypothetical protein
MPKPTTDKLVCRHCRLREPAVAIRRVKGVPRGECTECNRKLQLRARLKRNFALGLYQSLPELVAANLKALSTLKPGAYRLLDVATREQAGYIATKTGKIYVNTWNNEALFRRHWFEVASYIGNLGLYIDPKPAPIHGPNGEALELEAIGSTLALENAADRLVWYDPSLLAKAVRLVREDLREKRRQAMALARSKNPKAKTAPNPAE